MKSSNSFNIHLIPTLTSPLIYNYLSHDKLDIMNALICTHISKSGKLSYCTPNKTKFSFQGLLGLNITKVSITAHLQIINHILRYSFLHGPKNTNDTVINALLTDSQDPNVLQHITASSANFLRYHFHNIPNINPCPLNQIPAHTPTKIAFTYYQSTTDTPTYSLTQSSQHHGKATIWHLGTRDHPIQHKTTAMFADKTT